MPATEHVALREKIAPLWISALGLDGEVPGQTSFWKLGGYSLLAVALAEQMSQAIGFEVPGTLLFEHPTLDQVVATLAARAPSTPAKAPPTTPVESRPEDEPFVLSDLQQAYWLGEEGSFELSGPAFFFESYEVRDLDVERLRHAITQLAARQGMLRATFLDDGSQAVGPADTSLLHVHPLGERSPSDVERVIAEHRANVEHSLCPLSQGPPIRIDVFETPTHHVVHVLGRLIVFDGLSGYIFADELRALYEGRALPELRSGYGDYRRAFESMKEGDAYARSLAYWSERLDTLPAAPELPEQRTDGASSMRRRTHRVDPERWAAFQAHCRAAAVTPTMALCTAFSEVLAAWSRSSHFSLNVMYGQRLPLVPDVERIVGNFSSTLLLEYDGRSDVHFAERASTLQARFGRDLEHGAVTGVSVLRQLNQRWGRRAQASMPVVFASVLGAQRGEDDRLFLERMDWTRLDGAIQTPQVAFDHQVFETADGLVLHWDTLDERYPPGLLDAMFDAYRTLVDRLADHAEAWSRPAHPPLPQRQQDVRAQANDTHAKFEPQALHAGFVEQARSHPERIAVVCTDATITYGELLDAAMQIASALVDAGHQPNDPVAIVAEKGWRQIAAMLGVLCAAGVYVPLSPDTPTTRQRSIARKAGFGYRLVGSAHLELSEWDGHTIDIDEAIDRSTKPNDAATARLATSLKQRDELAYVIYTSGTTGEPKGVMIPHLGAVNTIDDLNHRFELRPTDRVLGVSAYTFDLSVYDVFGLLRAGGAIVLPSPEHARDPEHLFALARSHGVTVWNSVPAYFSLLAEYALARSDAHDSVLPALRLVLLSGDWIGLDLPADVRALAPRARCISLGGATEASIWSNYFEIPTPVPSHWASIPYGHPLQNQRFFVLDDALRDRPDWVPGELFIAGHGLARGYQGDTATTEASFLRHPRSGELLYRTGDWGRYWPDGTLEFLGRQDGQVKLGGFRVELSEVERCLDSHPGVRSAVALVHGPAGRRQLYAFVHADDRAGEPTPPTAEPLAELLAERVRDTLPPYMHPRSIEVLAEFPLTANGKLDRSALMREVDSAAEQTASAQVGGTQDRPPTEREARLQKIWTQVLGAAPRRLDEDFFAAGGTSLTAARLMNAIERAFGVRPPLAVLYQHPTIPGLAAQLQQAREQLASAALWLTPREAPTVAAVVHPIGGDVLCYRPLVSALGEQVAVLGFQAFGQHDHARPLRSVHAMADRYLGLLPERSPERSPDLIIGWSFGGVVAYEIGRRLHEAHGHSPRIAMIDPWLSSGSSGTVASLSQLVRLFFHDLTGGTHYPAEVPSATERDALLHDAWQHAREQNTPLQETPLEEVVRMFEVYEANNAALADYRWRPDPALTATVFECQDASIGATHPHLKPLREHDPSCAAITWESIPGNHYSALQGDHAIALGARLRHWSQDPHG